MRTKLLCGLVGAVIAMATGCNGGLGDDSGGGAGTASEVEAPVPTDEEIPGVGVTRTAEPPGEEIPGVTPRPTKLPSCSEDSSLAVDSCIDDALDLERDALRSAGDDDRLADLDQRSADLDGLDGYDWRSAEARGLYERAKALDAAGP